MRIACRRDHLQRLPNPSIHSDRIHAHEVCTVRRPEEKAAATIKRDVREAFGERPRANELERAGTWINAVAVRLVRFGAHRGDEKALVRAHGHWHDDLFRLETRSRAQRTVRLERIHPDVRRPRRWRRRRMWPRARGHPRPWTAGPQ